MTFRAWSLNCKALVARFEVVVGFEVDVGGSGIEVALVASFEVEVGGSGPFV
jgi:hypothetical protein